MKAGKCGCGRPISHGGRCAHRRSEQEKRERIRLKILKEGVSISLGLPEGGYLTIRCTTLPSRLTDSSIELLADLTERVRGYTNETGMNQDRSARKLE